MWGGDWTNGCYNIRSKCGELRTLLNHDLHRAISNKFQNRGSDLDFQFTWLHHMQWFFVRLSFKGLITRGAGYRVYKRGTNEINYFYHSFYFTVLSSISLSVFRHPCLFSHLSALHDMWALTQHCHMFQKTNSSLPLNCCIGWILALFPTFRNYIPPPHLGFKAAAWTLAHLDHDDDWNMYLRNIMNIAFYEVFLWLSN
jgi:hypothetical protein